MRLIYACSLDGIRQSANSTRQIVACKRTFRIWFKRLVPELTLPVLIFNNSFFSEFASCKQWVNFKPGLTLIVLEQPSPEFYVRRSIGKLNGLEKSGGEGGARLKLGGGGMRYP